MFAKIKSRFSCPAFICPTFVRSTFVRSTFVFLFLFLFLFLSLPVNVPAQTDWFFVALNSDGTRIFIDRDFMRQPNGLMRVWQKGLSPDGTMLVSLMEWNCPQKKFRFLRLLLYAPDGSIMNKTDQPQPWQTFIPDSTGMFLYRNICDASLGVNSNTYPVTKPAALFARIIVRQASLRRDADAASEVIRKFSFGEKLILLDGSPVKGWYQAADIKNNVRGWISGNDFKIIKVKKPTGRIKPGRIK